MSFWTRKKVLVTGGAGFIGSYLVERLVKEGAIVSVVDNLERGSLNKLSAVASDIRFMKGDLRDKNECDAFTAGVDVVFHLAAKAVGLEYSLSHQSEMFSENLLINANVLRASLKNNVSRLLAVSTSCVYPDDAAVPTPETKGWEGTPESANEGYGWAKRMLEKQATYYANEHGMEIAIVRPFNVYGGRTYWDDVKSHVIPTLINKIMGKDDPVVVWGSGDQSRSFIHVKDVARAFLELTERYAICDPVNLGYPEELTIRQLVTHLMKITGSKKRIIYDTSKPEGKRRKGADMSKFFSILTDFGIFISYEEGLHDVVQDYPG